MQPASEGSTGGTAPGYFPLPAPSSSAPSCALTSSPQASQGVAAPTSLFAMAPQPRTLQGQGARGLGVHMSLKLPHVHCMCVHGSRGPCFRPHRIPLCICCSSSARPGVRVPGAVPLLVPLPCRWGHSPHGSGPHLSLMTSGASWEDETLGFRIHVCVLPCAHQLPWQQGAWGNPCRHSSGGAEGDGSLWLPL